MSSAVNTLRQVLVFGAVIAAIVAAGGGRWLVVAILVPGLLAHVAMSAWLKRGGATGEPTAAGTQGTAAPRTQPPNI